MKSGRGRLPGEATKRKKETGYGRRDRGNKEPIRPTVESLVGEDSEQNDQACKNRNEANERVNYCVDLQYHFIAPALSF